MASPIAIPVCIRVRPLSASEVARDQRECWRIEGKTISYSHVANCNYSFDHIFGTSCSTKDIFDEIARPVVLSALQGFNGNIFAYGQTSSGKTFTMSGHGTTEGIIHLAAQSLFSHILFDTAHRYSVTASYLEIYNEKIADLLEPSTQTLSIRQDFSGACYIPGLCQIEVANAEGVIAALQQGNEARQTASTNLNERSSRSHTIFQLVIERRNPVSEETCRSVLNLIDLAGSERANQTQAQGKVLNEAKYINKSLLALSNVIKRLSDMKESGQEGYVNFRDSVLTRILQPALGGNSKTAIICTVAPGDFRESESTLQFASRAKTIKNKAQVNEVVDQQALTRKAERDNMALRQRIQQLELENENLRRMATHEAALRELTHESPPAKRRRSSDLATFARSESEDLIGGSVGAPIQMQELQRALAERQAELEELHLQIEAMTIATTRQVAERDNHAHATDIQCQIYASRIAELERANAESEESLSFFKSKVQTLEELFETVFQEKQLMREDFKLRRQKDQEKLREKHSAELKELNDRWQQRYTALQLLAGKVQRAYKGIAPTETC
eukprot:TRINITY_DN277_c0_g1_i1.p1 TRINITY_DN277_c0_g1~~TRINITY_DN277_c0_g1_i1.p1  ORF type:complete len:563 (+),score=83.82 TRINITY_DN277_c0_g1_i1:58-1746(+)